LPPPPALWRACCASRWTLTPRGWGWRHSTWWVAWGLGFGKLGVWKLEWGWVQLCWATPHPAPANLPSKQPCQQPPTSPQTTPLNPPFSIRQVQSVCRLVVRRSARMAATALLAILRLQVSGVGWGGC
jgi:hypothetical protein